MHKSISVWLKIEDGENAGKFVLQRRSEANKSFAFVCQSTWSGKLEEGEEIQDAIQREFVEELGLAFAESLDFYKLHFFSETEYEMKGEKWTAHNYVGTVTEKSLPLVKLIPEVSNLEIVGKNDEIFPYEPTADRKSKIYLFEDQYKILKQLLEK